MKLFNCFLSTLMKLLLKVRTAHSELYIKTFSSFEEESVEPKRMEKYQGFIPSADESIFAGDGKRTGTSTPISENADGNLVAPCNF